MVRIKKIVITGGPGTGKTSLIDNLRDRGHVCYPEISRQVTLEAREQGIEQLFLTDPLMFSQRLLEGRTNQFLHAERQKEGLIFLDRGIPDVLAYMEFIGDKYPGHFDQACKAHLYDQVFLLPPWEAIFESDSERYENFEQAIAIHDFLEATYKRYGYELLEVPFGSVDARTDFIEQHLIHP